MSAGEQPSQTETAGGEQLAVTAPFPRPVRLEYQPLEGQVRCSTYVGPAPSEMPRFRLRSLMLTMALIGGCLAVARLTPSGAIVLAIVLAPAYIRTVLAAEAWSLAGRPMSVPRQVLVMVESVVVVVELAIVALGTWAFVFGGLMYAGYELGQLLPAHLDELMLGGMIAGLALGGAVSFWTMVALGQKIWPAALPGQEADKPADREKPTPKSKPESTPESKPAAKPAAT